LLLSILLGGADLMDRRVEGLAAALFALLWQYTGQARPRRAACIKLCACSTILVLGIVAAIILSAHPHSVLGTRWWVVYVIGYTIFSTGFATLARHRQTRRRME
jgi:hypothetical protein